MSFPFFFNAVIDWGQALVLNNRLVTGGGCCPFVLDIET